jgi:hypothetical protein
MDGLASYRPGRAHQQSLPAFARWRLAEFLGGRALWTGSWTCCSTPSTVWRSSNRPPPTISPTRRRRATQPRTSISRRACSRPSTRPPGERPAPSSRPIRPLPPPTGTTSTPAPNWSTPRGDAAVPDHGRHAQRPVPAHLRCGRRELLMSLFGSLDIAGTGIGAAQDVAQHDGREHRQHGRRQPHRRGRLRGPDAGVRPVGHRRAGR